MHVKTATRTRNSVSVTRFHVLHLIPPGTWFWIRFTHVIGPIHIAHNGGAHMHSACIPPLPWSSRAAAHVRQKEFTQQCLTSSAIYQLRLYRVYIALTRPPILHPTPIFGSCTLRDARTRCLRMFPLPLPVCTLLLRTLQIL